MTGLDPKLADQLLVTGLNQTGLDAGVRWQKMFATVGSAISATDAISTKGPSHSRLA
jgi:hypothetical protein